MTLDAALALTTAAPASTATGGAAPVQVGYGVSLTDVGRFERALEGAGLRLEARPAQAGGEAARQLLRPLDHINGEAAKLSLDAQAAKAAGRDMSPGEMVTLTVRCQEFMFHCQLTSNIANRTSDGLQQLFRQQG